MMKKILITAIATIFSIIACMGQVKLLPSEIERAITFVKKDSDRYYNLGLNDTEYYKNFNALLSTRNSMYLFAVDDEVAGKIDGNTINSCHKLNDSIYEIDVQNLARQIILIFSESKKKLWFDENENEELKALFPPLEMNVYRDSVTHKRYMAMIYNPILEDWSLLDSSKKRIITFILRYVFPKPVISFQSVDDILIKKKLQNPSHIYHSSETDKNSLSNTSEFPMNKSLLFVFGHFLGNARSESNGEGNDFIQYKLDGATDWSYTALSYTPSILLQNLSSGKHVLYAKYPSKNADILAYHFTIAPN